MTVIDNLLLGADAVEDHATMPAVIDAVAAAFAAEPGDTSMPAKSYIDLPQYNGDFRSMPAYVDAATWDAAAVKWVNVHLDNPRDHDLPTVLGTLIYSDPETAFPLAVMDGTVLTRLRTGAAAAVATDHLAVADADSLGLVGAGTQAYTQLALFRRSGTSRRWSSPTGTRRNSRRSSTRSPTGSTCGRAALRTPPAVMCVDDHARRVADRRPEVARRAHTRQRHRGRRRRQAEHSERTLLDAKLVIDNYEQCTHSGEINVPYHEGTLTDYRHLRGTRRHRRGHALGADRRRRHHAFDSTGLAIQDVAAAHVVYENASDDGDGTAFSLVDTETS